MKYFLMLMVMILSVSCKDDKNSRYGFDSKDYKENRIDFIHGILLLPKDYFEMSEEEFLFYAEKSDHVTSIAVRMMDFSQGSKFDYVGYTKENNLNDLVLVHSGEYVNFSKRNADQYLGMLEANLKQSWGGLGIEYSRMEQKMTRTERSKYIKIKYRLKANMEELFFTQYIVTSSISTFGVLVINTTGADQEELIKRILFKF